MKRALSLFLCLAMLVACFSVSALAASGSKQVYTTDTNLFKGTLSGYLYTNVFGHPNWELTMEANWSGSPAAVYAKLQTVNYLTGATFLPTISQLNSNSNWSSVTQYPGFQNIKITMYGTAEVYGSNFSGLLELREIGVSLSNPY